MVVVMIVFVAVFASDWFERKLLKLFWLLLGEWVGAQLRDIEVYEEENSERDGCARSDVK